MVKFTHKLVHRVKHLLHTKFQQSTTNGGDAMTILVMTYFIDGFQPEGPLKRILILLSFFKVVLYKKNRISS